MFTLVSALPGDAQQFARVVGVPRPTFNDISLKSEVFRGAWMQTLNFGIPGVAEGMTSYR